MMMVAVVEAQQPYLPPVVPAQPAHCWRGALAASPVATPPPGRTYSHIAAGYCYVVAIEEELLGGEYSKFGLWSPYDQLTEAFWPSSSFDADIINSGLTSPSRPFSGKCDQSVSWCGQNAQGLTQCFLGSKPGVVGSIPSSR
jgi:hypothetical protein